MIHFLAHRAGSVAKVVDNLAASLLSDLVKMNGNSKMYLRILITIFICKCHGQVAEQTFLLFLLNCSCYFLFYLLLPF